MEITQSKNRVTVKCPNKEADEAWAWVKRNNYRVCTVVREGGQMTITATRQYPEAAISLQR